MLLCKNYFGRKRKPFKVPKFIAMPGVIFRSVLGGFLGNKPFERPWMIRYIDRKLVVNASYTEISLDWKIPGRNDILRRLLFMIENMKNHYVEWTVKNETQMVRTTARFNLRAYEVMLRNRDLIINRMLDFVNRPENTDRFANYRKMEKLVLKWYITMLYQLIATSIKVGDRILIRRYIQTIAYRRFKTGFKVTEPVDFLTRFEKIIKEELLIDPETSNTKDQLFNAISISIQLSIDEMEESFEIFENQFQELTPLPERGPSLQNVGNLKQIISGLEDTFFDSIESDLMTDFISIRDQIPR